jgi:rod shape-determining protein MreD
MKYIYFPLLFGSALILQSAVVPVVMHGWFVEGLDLPLIIVLHVAMTRGKSSGMMTGLVMGYLQDAMSGGVLGFNGISKIIAGYMGGYFREKFFVGSMAHRTASVAGAVFVALLAKVAVLALFVQPRPSLFSTQFLWGFAGNTLFALLIHGLLNRFEPVFGIRVEEELSLGD